MANSQKGVLQQIDEKDKELAELEKQYLEVIPDEDKMEELENKMNEVKN